MKRQTRRQRCPVTGRWPALTGALLAVCLAGPAVPADTPPLFGRVPVAETRADAGRGQAIAAQGGAQACVTCHGSAGQGTPREGIPALAGLPRAYLAAQLQAYAGGTRENAVMQPVAARLDARARADVAAYYAQLDRDTRAAPEGNMALLQRGGALAATGMRPGSDPVTACSSCHGAGASGVPRLAGQPAGYIAAQLRAWQAGRRRNDPLGVMISVAEALADPDVDAVAAYYAALRR